MSCKRIFAKTDKKARTCLKCGAPIADGTLKNNKPYTCQNCGHVHFVDIFGVSIALTSADHPELRKKRQPTPEEVQIMHLERERQQLRESVETLKKIVETQEATIKTEKEISDRWRQQAQQYKTEAEQAREIAKEWEKAADGLARIIEDYKEQERRQQAKK